MNEPGKDGSSGGQIGLPTGELAIELIDEDLRFEDVLLRTAGCEPLSCDISEVFEDSAVLGENLESLLAGVEVAVGAFDGADGVELGGGQFGKGDLNVPLRRLSSEPERTTPGELLSEREVIRIVTHQIILRRHAGDRKDGVRRHRVLERGDLGDPESQRLDVVIGSLDCPVLGECGG